MSEDTENDVDFGEAGGRSVRSESQFEKEDELVLGLKGESAPDRFVRIRGELYHEFMNIHGVKRDILSRDCELTDYPGAQRVAEVYLPSLYRFVDSEHGRISQLSESEKSEQGKRLAVVLYLLSLTIHQANDGNNQTTEIMTLSYLREFCPEYTESYFPIKYGGEEPIHKSKLLSVSEDGMLAIEDTSPIELKEEDLRRMDVINGLRTKKRELEHKLTEGNYTYEAYKSEIGQYLDGLLKSYSDSESEDFQFVRTKLEEGKSPVAVTAFLQYLASEIVVNNPGYSMTWTGHSLRSRAAVRTYIAEVLLNTPEGMAVLGAYVDDGKDGVDRWISQNRKDTGRFGRIGELAKRFVQTCDESLGLINNTLTKETRGEHERKYIEAMRKEGVVG